MRRLLTLIRRHPVALLYAVVIVALVVRNLSDLAGSPPGLYSDEASIGYNAWTIAHYGVDEHGYAFPLFFEAFGEWKNPVYIYTLVPFVWLFGVSSVVIRTPAALYGIATCLLLAASAHQIWHRHRVTLLVLLLSVLVPWLTLESRIGFEVISMVGWMAAWLFFLTRGVVTQQRRWFLFAGIALAITIYAYSIGRLESGLLGVAATAALAYPWRQERRPWLWMWPPVIAGYLLLIWWNFQHPGALLARYDLIGITAGHPSLPAMAANFIANYFTYFGPYFLFINGDQDIRQSIAFDGELLLTMAPFVIVGLVSAVRRLRRDPFARLVVAGLIVAPVSAALTNDGTPHSLRSVPMLQFLVLLCGFGLVVVFRWWEERPQHSARALAGVLTAAFLIEGTVYDVHLFTVYPTISAFAWDVGMPESIALGHKLAGSHMTYVVESVGYDQPYIFAALLYLPPPPRTPLDDNVQVLTLPDRIEEVYVPPPLSPGDVVVEGIGQPPPPGAQAVTVVDNFAVIYQAPGG